MKLADVIKKILKENEDEISLNKPFAVIVIGGSIGQSRKNYIDKYKGYVTATFETPEEAKDYAKRFRKLLSKGEKSYYGMNYKAVKLTPSDINHLQ